MVRCLRWHCPPDTGFEIRALAVWGRARYLSVTEAPHNTDFHTWMGKKHFCFFQTTETGNRTPSSGVKGSGANHYPRTRRLFGIIILRHCERVILETTSLNYSWLICKNEMNRVLGHLCAHIGQTGPGEPPEDGEMFEMTLSSRHRIRNSSPGCLRPSTLPLGHGGSPQYWLSHVDG